VVTAFIDNVSQLTPRGFDYAGLRAGLKLSGRGLTPAQFADLQVMERVWLREIADG